MKTNKTAMTMLSTEAGAVLGGDRHIIDRLVKQGKLKPIIERPRLFSAKDVLAIKSEMAKEASRRRAAASVRKPSNVRTRTAMATGELDLDWGIASALSSRIDALERRLALLESRK